LVIKYEQFTYFENLVFLKRINCEYIILLGLPLFSNSLLVVFQCDIAGYRELRSGELLGGCPRIEAIARESGFEAIFSIK
jgi:hypothetical protein